MSQVFDALREAQELTESSGKAGKPRAVARAKRVAACMPVVLSGKDAKGRAFQETTRTIVVTRRGILVETVNQLAAGSEVLIENRALNRKVTGRVVSCATEPSSKHKNQAGIELADAESFCGVNLGPDNGDKGSAVQPEERPQPAAEAPAIDPEITEQAATGSNGEVTPEPELRTLTTSQEPATPARVPKAPPAVPRVPIATAVPKKSNGPDGSGQMRAGAGADLPLTTIDEKLAELVPRRSKVADERLEAVAERIVSQTQAKLEEWASRFREDLSTSLEQQLAPTWERLVKSRADLEGTLEGLDKRAKTKLDESTRRAQEGALNSFEERLAGLTERLESSRGQVEVVVEALGELQHRTQATMEESAARVHENTLKSLEQRLAPLAKRLESSRAEIESMLARLDELQRACHSSVDELEGDFKQLFKRQREAMEESLQQKFENASQQALAHIQSSGEQILKKASETLNERAFVTVDMLKDWSKQATERLEAHAQEIGSQLTESLENLRKQARDMSAGILDKLNRETGKMTADLMERFLNNARAMESTTVNAVRQKLDAVARELTESSGPELFEDSAAKLRKLAEDSVQLIAAQLAKKQEQLISDTEKAFRQKIGDMLMMLQGGSAKKG